MNREARPAVILLVICAVADIVSAPPLLFASDRPSLWVGVTTGVVGVLTAIAAYGLARRAPWAKPLAQGGRALDILTAIPGFTAGMPAPVIVSAVIALSLITMVAVARVDVTAAESASPGRTLAT